jgi:hypothetical protein
MTAPVDRYPTAGLSTVAMLRVLAASLTGVAYEERIIETPFERTWEFISDIEHSVPTFDQLVTSITITKHNGSGQPIRIKAGPLGISMRVDLRPGCCIMSAPTYLVAMAAEPSGPHHTRYAHLEGTPPRGPRWVQRLIANPLRLIQPLHGHHVRSDVTAITHYLTAQTNGKP